MNNGIPAECDGMPTELSLSYGDVKVARDQTIDENDGFLKIKAEFKSKFLLKGTVEVDGEGQGVYCTSNGKIKFKAALVS